ncbi:MAG TPA: sulfite exporter TauE/SafE family protein [Nitrospiria bacterium]|nr:sulfite exporter TauE/SafE family protein [Nitrospiria bacterium]
MPSDLIWLLPLFLLAAMLYSSVGHGGASAYLAILVLAGYARPEIAPTVLILNILVTVTGLTNYYRAGYFTSRILWPFILASIPAAYLGGMIPLSQPVFSGILGGTLFIAGLRFILFTKPILPRPPVNAVWIYAIGLPVGLVLGFLAGLIGIGGGIFLSPLLLLMGWANAKQTAAVSAAFIILNSLSGLAAHALNGTMHPGLALPLGLTVLIGGQIGSWWGARKIPPKVLQQVLGTVLLTASLRMIYDLL